MPRRSNTRTINADLMSTLHCTILRDILELLLHYLHCTTLTGAVLPIMAVLLTSNLDHLVFAAGNIMGRRKKLIVALPILQTILTAIIQPADMDLLYH